MVAITFSFAVMKILNFLVQVNLYGKEALTLAKAQMEELYFAKAQMEKLKKYPRHAEKYPCD